FGDPDGEAYFMVTNALGAYLNDSTATVAQTQQQITMNFDSQYSGISTLQRLRRSDGQLEIVPLTNISGRQYQLVFTLEGGTGGAVSLGTAMTVNSLSFKSNGYTISGSTLNMAGQFISADNGISATIGSVVAGSGGVVKSGPGTVILSNTANTYTGGAALLG